MIVGPSIGLLPLGRFYDLEASRTAMTMNNDIPTTYRMIESADAKAYWGNTRISKIRLAEGCKTIGECAFGFSSLKEIILPGSLVAVGSCAFSGLINLRSITIPEGTVSLGSMVFAGCTNLEKVTFPSTIKNVGDFPFLECSNLKRIEVPAAVFNNLRYSEWLQKHDDIVIILVDGALNDRKLSANHCTDSHDGSEYAQVTEKAGSNGNELSYVEDSESVSEQPQIDLPQSTDAIYLGLETDAHIDNEEGQESVIPSFSDLDDNDSGDDELGVDDESDADDDEWDTEDDLFENMTLSDSGELSIDIQEQQNEECNVNNQTSDDKGDEAIQVETDASDKTEMPRLTSFLAWQQSKQTSNTGKSVVHFVGANPLDEDLPIEVLGLSTRGIGSLSRCGIRTVNDLCWAKKSDIENIRNIGQKTCNEIFSKLKYFLETGKTAREPISIPIVDGSIDKENNETCTVGDESNANTVAPILVSDCTLSIDQPIEALQLSKRAYNCLKRGKINTINTLCNTERSELDRIPNLGKNSIKEIIEKLDSYFACNDNPGVDHGIAENTEKDNQQNSRAIKELPLESLGLSVRAYNGLRSNGILHLSDLMRYSEQELMGLKNLGKKSVLEIIGKRKGFEKEYHDFQSDKLLNSLPGIIKAGMQDYLEKMKSQADLPLLQQISDVCVESTDLSEDDVMRIIVTDERIISTCKRIITDKAINQGFMGLTKKEAQSLLPAFLAEDLFSACLEQLEEDDDYRFVQERIYRVFRSFVDYVEDLPDERNKKIILGRMQGKTLADMADAIGITRERVRQIENKFWRKARLVSELFEEDKYVPLYEKYRIGARLFRVIFEESSVTWYIVCNRSDRENKFAAHKEKLVGSDRDADVKCSQIEDGYLKDIELAVYDESLNDEVRQAIHQYFKNEEDASFVQIGMEKIPARREDIEDYVLRNYCQDEMFIDDFYELYNDVLVNAGCDREELMATESVRRTRENRISANPYVLWSYKRRMRYYNVDAYDFGKFFRQLKLDRFVDIEISTRKLMLEFPDLMVKYDIRNEYELHNLMKKQGADVLYGDLVFGKMPMLQFGNVDRTRYITGLLFSLAPISKDDFFEAVSQETGIQPEIVGTKQEFMSAIDVYLHDGMLTINSDPMPDNEMEVMLKTLTEDFYTIDEIRTLYMKVTGYSDCELVSPYNMKRMGFKVYSGYILRNAPSAEAYFTRLLTAREIVDYSDYAERFKYIREWACTLGKLKDDFIILEFLPQQVINYSRLQKFGVTKDGLMAFCDSVYAFTDPGQYFTVESLRKDGFDSKLFELGFEDWFYSSIIREDSRFGYRRMGYGKAIILFCRDVPKVTRQSFLAYVLDGESEDVDVLLDEIKNTYGIIIDRYDMNQILADSDMYYDSTMEKVYANKELYYEEV